MTSCGCTSLPSWVAPYAGAWIEIDGGVSTLLIAPSRPTRARGLKFLSMSTFYA